MNKIVCLALFAILYSCNEAPEKKQTEKQTETPSSIVLSKEKLRLISLQIDTIKEEMVQNHFTAPGKVVILSQYQAGVTPKIEGSVEKILVLEGQRVSKGQCLMTISSKELVTLQEDFLATKAELLYAAEDYKRQQKLRSEMVIGEKEFQQIQSKYELLLSKHRGAEARLQVVGISPSSLRSDKPLLTSVNILSPISGYILSLPVNIGMSVIPTSELAHIVNTDEYHADLFVYEKDVHRVSEKMPVTLRFNNSRITDAKGQVEFIARGFDPVKRTVTVHAVFKTTNPYVLPDMTITGSFEAKAELKTTVPETAVEKSGHSYFIYLASSEKDNIRFTKKSVNVLFVSDGKCVLSDSGLAGKALVKNGSTLIAGEMKRDEMKED
jgi:cobalt-zinc-cadmium efflux system membrane fusion protein